MKKFFTIVLLLSGILKMASAQAPNWLWAEGTGLSGFQYGSTLYASKTGDIFTSGRLTNGTSVLGGVSVNSGGTLAFNGRFNAAGTFSWASVYPYGGFDYLFAYYLDAAGNGYSTGCVNSSSFWVQRVNSAGVLTWSNTVGTGGTQGSAIVADSKGNIYVGGGFNSASTFGSYTVTPSGGQSFFLVKYNNAGVVQWAENIGTSGIVSMKSLAVDKQDNIYFTGGYTGSPALGSFTLPSYSGNENYFVAKYDSLGNALRVTTAGNAGPVTSLDNGSDLKIDSLGNLYVTSAFQLTAQFGSFNLTSAGGYDMFVGKLDTGGNWLWVNSAGGTANREEGTGIAIDKDLDVYVAGIFQNTSYFGCASIANSNSGKDGMYVAKYGGKLGDFQWVQSSVASGGDENSSGITVDNQKFVYVTGDFVGTAVFGSNSVIAASNYPNNDLYIAKLDTLPNLHISVHPDSSYCQGSSQALPFSATGNFGGSNTFTAQLSDSTGNFSSPTVIGNLSGNNGGSLPATIPQGTPSGKNYVIRIISSDPVDTSAAYCYKIQILSAVALITSDDTTVCSGSQVQLSVSGGTGGYIWSSVNQLSCTNCSNPIVSVNLADTLKVTAASGIGCKAMGSVIIQLGGSYTGGIISAIRDTICQGTPGTLTLTGSSGDSLKWQSSPDEITFTNTGGTSLNYKTLPLEQTTWFRVLVGTGSCSSISDTLSLYVPPALTASFNSTQTSATTLSFDSDSSSGSIRSYHWDFGDGQTSDEQNPQHTYAKDSTYYVCLTLYDGSNCSYTFCRYSLVTGIPTISAAGNWVIEPNPFSSQLSVRSSQLTESSKIQSIEMYDVLGRVVINKELGNATNTSLQLDVSSLAKGMYYVMIRTANADYVQKVVKQ